MWRYLAFAPAYPEPDCTETNLIRRKFSRMPVLSHLLTYDTAADNDSMFTEHITSLYKRPLAHLPWSPSLHRFIVLKIHGARKNRWHSIPLRTIRMVQISSLEPRIPWSEVATLQRPFIQIPVLTAVQSTVRHYARGIEGSSTKD